MTTAQDEGAGALAPVDIAFVAAHPAHMLAIVGGAGLFPYGPGTVGALVGIPAGLLLAMLPAIVSGLILVATFLIGVWACRTAAASAGVHDHPAIVFDETWAMAAVLAFAPAGGWAVLAGFLAFRLFDIAKPWPIGLIDRQVDDGLGIMLDDAVAAIFALAVVAGLWRLGVV
ncbi:MAG: phosphatidylglycerophosphatase A [Phreatobacter sp.]|uniref:phosphatidylglycerophosphatase A family protein n=1 Tax=Phreatobacter sp. TaxID=1966341 RepID=UPI001A3C086E|nr:phosphatidylglycerophosphatase A [Phreatobacter sp.]MBL8569041.1 phosphatidylglycerophosphatase A [Phreatobacter sp.]